MLNEDFVNVRILKNFYQTSSFFPMPVVLVSTLAETGQTNLGSYSLCFPYIISGEFSMMLGTREGSNTSQNIQRTGVCALNFVPDKRKYMENCVMLGFPGETTEEKMRHSIFTLQPSSREAAERQPDTVYPEIVQEAVQVFECTWDQRYPIKQDPESAECHFVLRVNKIVMKERWRDNLLGGRHFPPLPINYGYRDNAYFWFTKASRAYQLPIPEEKRVSTSSIRFAAERIDPDFDWQEEAYAKLTKVPRVFLGRVIRDTLAAAKAEGINEITPEFLDLIRDKRNKEKK